MENFSALLSVILLPILIILLRLILTPTPSSNLPPGPPKLPIIGNLHQLVSKNTPPPHRLQELARVYGPIVHLRLGEVPTVVISSAEVAKEVLRTHDANFANRPLFMASRDFYYDPTGNIGIIFAPYSDYWRHVRKIATLELFTAKRVQGVRATREEEVANFIGSIMTEANNGSLINLSDQVFGLVFNLMSRMVFRKIGKEKEAFRNLVAEMSKALSGFTIADLYPSIKLLNSMNGMRRLLKKLMEESDRILDPIIEDHKCNKISKTKVDEDLVDVLLNFHREDTSPEDVDFSLSTNNIKSIILEIFGAGIETSSTTIEWVMSELLKNPNAMEIAQSEVRQVYVAKETIDESMLEDLKYLKLVIKETLRLHPPAPLLVPRESIDQSQIHGYDIPPKTRIVVNAYAMGRDHNSWTEPNVFKPERFEGCSIDYKGNNFELIPFGSGRRMCPGMTLGVANIELPLAMLLYHFDWKLPLGICSENLDMGEMFGLTMRRKNDLMVSPVPYTASSLSYQ